MIISGKYEVPDSCPTDCPFYGDFRDMGQCSICLRCPVINCAVIPGTDVCLIEPQDFRPDWAKEWQEFFKDYSKEPELKLKME